MQKELSTSDHAIYMRERRKTHLIPRKPLTPEQKGKKKVYQREWFKNNPRTSEQKKKWNAYMRQWRKNNTESPTDQQRVKKKARTWANNYLRTGKLQKKPCENCGSEHRVEMHHENYRSPLEITWLCHGCHRNHHNMIAV